LNENRIKLNRVHWEMNSRKQRKLRLSKPELALFILEKAFDGHKNAQEPETTFPISNHWLNEAQMISFSVRA